MFCSLARGMKPELGKKISVFIALAPAVFAGPLTTGFPFGALKSMEWKTWKRFFGISFSNLSWIKAGNRRMKYRSHGFRTFNENCLRLDSKFTLFFIRLSGQFFTKRNYLTSLDSTSFGFN